MSVRRTRDKVKDRYPIRCRHCHARLETVRFSSAPHWRPCDEGTRAVHRCYVERKEFAA